MNKISSLKNGNRNILTDLKEISDEFNRTFANTGKYLAQKI